MEGGAEVNASDLVKAVGNDNITFQWLHDCLTDVTKTKQGSKVTFCTTGITPREVLTGETRNVCMILWIPKDRYKEALAEDAAIKHAKGEG